jgi:hypothetical protein
MRKFLRWIILSEKEWNWQLDQIKEIVRGLEKMLALMEEIKHEHGI